MQLLCLWNNMAMPLPVIANFTARKVKENFLKVQRFEKICHAFFVVKQSQRTMNSWKIMKCLMQEVNQMIRAPRHEYIYTDTSMLSKVPPPGFEQISELAVYRKLCQSIKQRKIWIIGKVNQLEDNKMISSDRFLSQLTIYMNINLMRWTHTLKPLKQRELLT